MGAAAAHTWFMIGRQGRNLLRQPIWIAIFLVQPMIWLLLYGQLFKRVVDLPGFESGSYVTFLAPGIVAMNAFFGAMWSGMAMINDIDRGVLERFLATPASRVALVLSQVVRAGLTAALQTVVIMLVALVLGVHASQGAAGWLLVVLVAWLLGMVFAGVSHGLALLVRKEESMIGIANFIGLPLLVLSTALIARDSMPGWMAHVARFNPVNWGVEAAREPILAGTDWAALAVYMVALAALAVVTAAFATWCFRAYQRSL
jgi:ABC-2 type transport system permease protein